MAFRLNNTIAIFNMMMSIASVQEQHVNKPKQIA
jgi:hypothetical protein